MAAPDGAQHCAGILIDDKLSPGAKKRFINDVINELVKGTAGISVPPLPCGPKFEPVPFASMLDLADEKQFPDFHKNVLGLYEQIAKALDVSSQFTILPICDPIALAFKLGVNVKIPFAQFPLYGISLPLLALKLGLEPPELALKIPMLIVPPIPKLPLPLPIDIKIPDFQQLFEFSMFPLKIPEIVLNLMLQMPSIFLKILSFDLSAFCEPVLSAKMFGDFDVNKALVWAVAMKVLVRKTAECVSICVVANTVGAASGGIAGALGSLYGYDPPPPEESEEKDVRDTIVNAALKMDGKSWSGDKKSLKKDKNDFSKAKLEYTQWVLPHELSPAPKPGEDPKPFDANEFAKNTQLAYNKAKSLSSCGLFVRGCYIRGGASDPDGSSYFESEYKASTAISGLVSIASKRDAFIEFTSSPPSLRRGDAIITYDPKENGKEHVLMLTENFSGGTDEPVSAIQGGAPDKDNSNAPTAIKKSELRFYKKAGKLVMGSSADDKDKREVYRIVDAEKICV